MCLTVWESLIEDHEWDRKVWEESWDMRTRQDMIKNLLGVECSDTIEGALNKKHSLKRSRDADILQVKSKKRKLDEEEEAGWGGQGGQETGNRKTCPEEADSSN